MIFLITKFLKNTGCLVFQTDFWEIANECSLNNSKNWIFNFEIY